ncbi:hypothetical protein [Pontibacter actiniarum]|uniref:DUF3945 domain-containing protein n=1 Tax=Pontibacter actiniarum TaxID=323450 RepID=A0A1X9YSA2_9BACT|nr:hypothetical protein [Pontibacter actiniarum]ARS35733.1 hypothetical protein CA264_09930 [Pontibacter actiniarum]
MNEKNFAYLRDQVKYTGFGEGLESQLREKMQQGGASFELFHNVSYGKDQMATVLEFRKSSQQDMYFFNRYLAALKPERAADSTEQTFYINKGNNITLKEAYNLLSGRAVNKDLTNKEGELYNAWLQLDFKQTDDRQNYLVKQFHHNYGYDLELALGKHPVKELKDAQEKSLLLESLRKGNRQAVTFELGEGREARYFVEASPRYKSVNVYDEHMQRVRPALSQQQAQTAGQEPQKTSQLAAWKENREEVRQKPPRKGRSIGS